LRLANGQRVWSWSWDMNMTIANAPVIKNGVIYLSESTYTDNTFTSPVSNAKYQSFVVALQASSGRQLWKDALVGNLSQLTIADDGTLYVSNGAVVLALSSDNGQRRWQYAPPSNDSLDYYTNTSPQVTNYAIATQGQRVYVILRYIEDGVHMVADLVALNNQNGYEEWRYHMHAGASLVPFLSYQGVIYLTYNRFTVDSSMPSGSFLVALNGENGSILWTYRQADQYYMSQPLIVGDVLCMTENVVYLSANAKPSKKVSDVVVLRRSDGRVVRRYTFSSKTSISVPVVSGSTLYLMVYTGTKNDTTITTAGAFDLRTGREMWSARIPQQAGGLRIMVSQGRVYVYSRVLFVLQQGSGKQEWTFPSNVGIYQVVPDVG
jgi:outer membrane protein assembly factor BamB